MRGGAGNGSGLPPALKVLAPGMHTTVQDLGRPGWQALGVPVSGALDPESLRLANALVGNLAGTAAIEILLGGPTFEVAADTARVALAGTGARFSTAPAWRSLTLRRGDVVRIVVGREASCAYLAVEGGLAVPSALGSASTYTRAGLGGFEGRALRTGDLVPLAVGCASEGSEQHLPSPPSADPGGPIRVVLGPQRDCFIDEALAALLGAEFRVSNHADRMGMRLDGPRLPHRAGWDIVSDAIPTGAIQVPGSGQPILLLADHQTTGGYPKIATVISADLPRVGRFRPGDALRFAAVAVEEAEQLARVAERRLAALAAAIEPTSMCVGLDLGRLYAGNLISGVVSAVE